MPDYRVTWEIDINADSPQEAAKQAWEHMQRPDSTANVFDVVDSKGNTTRVDLLELEEESDEPTT